MPPNLFLNPSFRLTHFGLYPANPQQNTWFRPVKQAINHNPHRWGPHETLLWGDTWANQKGHGKSDGRGWSKTLWGAVLSRGFETFRFTGSTCDLLWFGCHMTWEKIKYRHKKNLIIFWTASTKLDWALNLEEYRSNFSTSSYRLCHLVDITQPWQVVWSDVKVKESEEEAPGRCLVLATEDSEVPAAWPWHNEKMASCFFYNMWHFTDLEHGWLS